jgi:methyl-accepting chemotaxis protein
VDTAIHGIATVSENQSAAIEEIAAGAEEMSAQVAQLRGDALSVAETAEQLRVLMDRFILDDLPQVSERPPMPTRSSLRRIA